METRINLLRQRIKKARLWPLTVAIGKFFQYPARWAKKAVKIRERETHSVQFSIKMAFYQVCCLALRLMSALVST